jgi:hypothetical protein
MHNTTDFIEEMLWHITAIKYGHIDQKDEKFLNSVARQTIRGTPLTKRQFDVLALILGKHENYLNQQGFNFYFAVTQRKLGLRTVDKSRWIRYNATSNTFDVRFTFSMRIMKVFEPLRPLAGVFQLKSDSNIHSFVATSSNIKTVVSALIDKDFEIDDVIKSHYDKIMEMENNLTDFMPCITPDYKFSNVHENAIRSLEERFGKLCDKNVHLYQDRNDMYGIGHIPANVMTESYKHNSLLTLNIAARYKKHIQIAPEDFTLKELFESLVALKRFPLLLIIDEDNALEQLQLTYKELRKCCNPEEISVMFRTNNAQFNDLVRETKLNSPVDKNTKVVYINKGRLPKPLLQQGWKPECALMLYSSRVHSNISGFTALLDLVIHYDESVSPWRNMSQLTQKITRNNAYIQHKNS